MTDQQLKVVICGDSIFAGVMYDENENRYVKSKVNFITMLQNTLNCAVTNLSRFGNTLLTALPKLKKGLEKEKPDIVLIELGGNDCDYKWDQIALDPKAEHFPATDINDFYNGLTDLSGSLLKCGVTPVITTLPPIDADRYFKWASKSSAEAASHILEWLGSVSRIYWWHERYNAAVLKVAEHFELTWIDIRSAFLSTPDYRYYLCKDGIHPNTEGHKIISKAINDYVETKYPMILKPAAAVS